MLKSAFGSKERMHKLIALTQKGDYKHNCVTVKNNKGYYIVSRKPTHEKASHTQYTHCSYCFGTFLKARLSKHAKGGLISEGISK